MFQSKKLKNYDMLFSKGKGRVFNRYASRGDPESSLPYFMQNYTNR